jgi:predicted transcriptional regulator
LENPAQIESLFFDLASESRLSILRELNEKNWKMNELARKLDLTTTETFRQLQRLVEDLLVQKQTDGTYSISLYGAIVLKLSPSLEFVFRHRDYFSTHDIRPLPYQFLNRISELSKAELGMDIMENINLSERITREAEEYMWGGGSEQPLNIGSIIGEKITKGVKFRFIFHEKFVPKKAPTLEMAQSVECRIMNDIPVNFVLTEKEAGISFNLVGGRADYAGFVSKDSIFVNWVKDLFLYYWEKGKRA